MIGKIHVYADEDGPLGHNVFDGHGTCFRVEDYIITAYHVIAAQKRMEIELDGNIFDAEIIALCPEFDLAVLKSEVPFKKLEIEDNVMLGEHVEAIGFPNGSIGSVVVTGTISGVASQYCGVGYTTSAHVYYGMSGGPALNDGGKVIGVSVVMSTTHNYWKSIISPSSSLMFLLDEITNSPKKGIRPGVFQGISMIDIRSHATANGSIVQHSNEKDILAGDIIMKIGEDKLTNGLIKFGDFQAPYSHIIGLKHPGSSVSLQILRKKKIVRVEHKLKSSTGVIPRCYEELVPEDKITIGDYTFVRFSWILLSAIRENGHDNVADMLLNRYADIKKPVMLCTNPNFMWAKLVKHDMHIIQLADPNTTILL